MTRTRIPAVSRRALLASAIGLGANRAAGEDTRVLSILCWPGYNDPTILDQFSHVSGIAVQAEPIAADDELFLYLRADGIGRIGVVTPTNGTVAALARAGLLQPLDPSRLRNAGNLLTPFREPAWTMADGRLYAVPLTWRTGPLAFNLDAGDPPGHWLELQDERFGKRLVMLDDDVGHLVTWNRARGLIDPVRVSTASLGETIDLLIQLKQRQVVRFTDSVRDAADLIANGPAWGVTAGLEALARKPGIALTHPQPGDYAVCAAAAIPAGAPDPDAAYAFIDHLLAPETQIALTGIMREGVVSADAVSRLAPIQAAPFDYGDLDRVFTTSPLVGLPPLDAEEDGIATYVDWVVAWDRVRFARTSLDPAPTPTPAPATPEPATPPA